MAKPIEFKPVPVDFKADLQKRLEKAPDEHAAALLAAYDVLEAAYDQGLLDMLHGLIESKETIISTLAHFSRQPEGVAGIRNVLTAAKIIAELNPEVLDHASSAMSRATAEHQREQTPPSLWHIFQRVNSDDGRRGLSFLTLLLSGFGKSLKEKPH